MNVKALVSPLALASALALTGGVAAQDMMLGDQTVTEDDVNLVRNFCADLSLEDARSDLDGGATSTSGDDDTGGDTSIEEDAANNVNDAFTNINFDTVTLEQCEEGGFLDDATGVEGEVEVEGEAEMAPQG